MPTQYAHIYETNLQCNVLYLSTLPSIILKNIYIHRYTQKYHLHSSFHIHIRLYDVSRDITENFQYQT